MSTVDHTRELPSDDASEIRRGFQHPFNLIVFAPLAGAYFVDMKWLVAISASIVIALLLANVGMLGMISVHTRRIALLLYDARNLQLEAKSSLKEILFVEQAIFNRKTTERD